MSPDWESSWRLGCFAGVLLVMGVWEWLAPRRRLTTARGTRWTSHLLLAAMNIAAARFLLPLTATGAAFWASEQGWGLLNLMKWPGSIELGLALLSLDLLIYAQHVLFHAVPMLWRLHKVHHADLDLDVTSGVRFHTLEILLSALLKVGAVLLLGPSVLAVIVFEILLNALAMFNHSNVRLPGLVDAWLRWVVVTPDMHRVHHSVVKAETNSNYGFNIPWWDYVFGTYHPQPAAGHTEMQLGLAEMRDERQVSPLLSILWLPFRSGLSTPTGPGAEVPQSTANE